MENKPAQNIQDTFLNTVRKDKTPITIYLVSGVKLTGKIRSFDKYSVLLENNSQEQLIFKHAISTVVSNRSVMHTEHRPMAVADGDRAIAGGCSFRDALLRRSSDSTRKRSRLAMKERGSGNSRAVSGVRFFGAETALGRLLAKLERAVLVGVDFTRAEPGVRAVNNRAGAAGARLAAVRSVTPKSPRIAGESLPDGAAETPDSQEFHQSGGGGLSASRVSAGLTASTSLDAEESLAEFRELVSSAGGSSGRRVDAAPFAARSGYADRRGQGRGD